MSLDPTNPVLGADHKPALGQTRGQDGNLEWFDSHTGTWRPAVRQHTIRNRLIRQSRLLGSYTYQRDGKGADVASFLPKDRDFGTAWAHRPAILFQLYPGHNRVSVKPQGVLMDGNRVMLDPYDHPIRDFPELPVTLSSKEKGMWIEYYMRQNREIKPYDLMARMGKSVNGNAVRIYTLNERATKFRNTAACLSWGEKTGSAEKKAYILGLLPAGATDTRSLGKDLTKQQQEELVAANKGQFPNRRRKAKRTLEAQAPMAVPTPGFQPGAPSVGGNVAGQSDQLGDEAELASLQGQDSQYIAGNGPLSFNDLSSFGSGSQLGAPQNMVGKDLNVPFSAGGANYHGYHHGPINQYPTSFLPPSQLHPSQSFLNDGRGLSSVNNPSDRSYFGNRPTQFNGMAPFSPAQYGAVYGGHIMGGSVPAGGAGGYTGIQERGDSVLDPPVNAPMQRRKRPSAALAEAGAETSPNPRRKRVRTEAPLEAPQEPPSPDSVAASEQSLLRCDEDGYVITNNTPGGQAQDEPLYPAAFDEFLRDTQYGEEDAEGEDEELYDALVAQGSNNELLNTPAPPPAQGQKRRRSSSPEDVEEVEEGPKSKRVRTEDDVQDPAESVDNRSEEAEAAPVSASRGQKRARSPESRGDTNSSTETPPAKRQRVTRSSDESTTSDRSNSTTTDDASNDDGASSSSHDSSSSDDSDGSEYTPSPYAQTSLKSIARPPTGGKGPYNADGRPVTGGKGKAPLKGSRRANIARKTPAKKQ